MSKEIAIGTAVITGDGGPYVYNGPNDNPQFISYVFGGGATAVLASPERVAPFDAVAPDLKDARISVANDPGNRPRSWDGPWRADIAGEYPRWFKTKRDAVAESARRLAIADWHNS